MDPHSPNPSSFGDTESEVSTKALLQKIFGLLPAMHQTTPEAIGVVSPFGLPDNAATSSAIHSNVISPNPPPTDIIMNALKQTGASVASNSPGGLSPQGQPSLSSPPSRNNIELPLSVQSAIEQASLNPADHPIAYGHLRDSLQHLHLGKNDLRELSLAKQLAKNIPHASSRPNGPFSSSSPLDHSHRHSTSIRPLDPVAIRAEFPAINQTINGHPLVWFDNAATTQKPKYVIDSMSNFYSRDYSNIHRAAHTLAARATDQYEEARETIRQFIHAGSANDIVFVRGTTEGINFIANACRSFLHEGDEILLTEMEHHANIVPWQLIARETRARIRVIPFDNNGELMLDEYRRLLSLRTKVVSVTHASNTLGTILPVEEIGAMAHRYGAKFVVDGAQSIAHLPIDVSAMNCDFFVFSGHKVYAPTGIGAVYIRPELQEILPPWQGGGNMIHRVTFDETTYAPPPNKFEAGTPSIGDAVGLRAALQFLRQFDINAVASYEHALLEHAIAELKPIDGVTLIGNAAKRTGLVSFTLRGFSTEQVGQELDRHGIAVRTGHHCAQPSLRHFGLESTIRPSFAIYNTHDEIDRMIRLVRKLSKQA